MSQTKKYNGGYFAIKTIIDNKDGALMYEENKR